jgi:hypothetical protein
MRRLLRRMWGAARLDAETFEEVEADREAIGQALAVVLLASLAITLAAWLQGARAGVPGPRLAFQVAISGLLPAVVWLGGSAFAFMVGASFLRGPETETDFQEVLRTTGFAFAPGVVRVLAFAPPWWLGLAVDALAWLWMVVAGVVAIRQALDFTTGRAVATFGGAAVLLWLVVWGLSVVPLPF